MARKGSKKQQAEATAPTRKSAAAATLMARNNWPGDFKRAVRLKRPTGKKNPRGEEIFEEFIDHTVAFPPGVPVEVDAEELEVCKNDIGDGKPLVYVEYDERGKPRTAASEPVAPAVDPNQLVELEEIINDQQDAIERLINQLKEAGLEPCVTMDDESGSGEGAGTE
ncbi:MAG: hypothetical protein AB7G28_20675 [Pirellulales bacterium]